MFGDVAELYSIVGRPNVATYTYSELKTATENFSCNNLLGEGGYGSVYKVSLFSTHGCHLLLNFTFAYNLFFFALKSTSSDISKCKYI